MENNMERVIIEEMTALGFTEKVGDIFIDWETVKDEILEPDKKAGTGNGTIHVFLGKEGYHLFKDLYPDYFNQAKSTNNTSANAPKVIHFFSKANLISSIGHVCSYYVRKNETGKVLDLVTKVATKLNETNDKCFTTESLFKWSTGSSDLRPYFKQFDESFQKTIRPLFLPNSAYKISIYKNKNNECAAFWLIGFAGLTDFEVDSSISYLLEKTDHCVCKENKLTEFILKCTEYFRNIDDLNSLVPYAEVKSANTPIKVSQYGNFSLTGMFIETEIGEIRRRNEQHSRWFENEFALGEKKVFLSTQWNANGNYQLTLTDFVKMIKTCYGDKYYYKSGQNGEHELWTEGPSSSNTNRMNLPLQQIFYGAPGTGKSNTIKCEVEVKKRIHFRTTFHPDSDYSTFVGCYKPTMKAVKKTVIIGQEEKDVKPLNAGEDSENKITYDFVPQAFTKAYCEAWNKYDGTAESEPVFLIIEEINRGNCAQIFGDIFQLLDRETEWVRTGFSTYPIDADEDLKKFLLTGTKEDGSRWLTNEDGIKGGKLCLPPNLYIWATMNTSDQSLFPIDSAFKRRWDWTYIRISEGRDKDTKEPLHYSFEVNHTAYDWWSFLKIINERIGSITSSEDKKLGYFFCGSEKENISAQKFVSKVCFYLWNDVFKDFGFGKKDQSAAFKKENGKDLAFDDFYMEDPETFKSKVDETMLENFIVKLGVETVEARKAREESAQAQQQPEVSAE